jgi:hypothetical protein
MTKCRSCGEGITKSEGADGLWYHTRFNLPPCDPGQVSPEAYRDDEGDKYPIAAPAVTLHHIPVHDCYRNIRDLDLYLYKWNCSKDELAQVQLRLDEALATIARMSDAALSSMAPDDGYTNEDF